MKYSMYFSIFACVPCANAGSSKSMHPYIFGQSYGSSTLPRLFVDFDASVDETFGSNEEAAMPATHRLLTETRHSRRVSRARRRQHRVVPVAWAARHRAFSLHHDDDNDDDEHDVAALSTGRCSIPVDSRPQSRRSGVAHTHRIIIIISCSRWVYFAARYSYVDSHT